MRRRLTAAVATVLLAGCGGGDDAATTAVTGPATAEAKRADRFDEDRAFALVRRQVEVFGQRPAGSPQLRRLAVELRDRLPRGRFEDLREHPGLRNVVGTVPGRRPAIVVGAHYDTEVLPQGFVGANDGAAGTAALVEVARAMRRVERPAGAPELRFVLFDGEEEPRPTDDFYRDALRGSKDYVARHRREVKAMVLLDYVANKGLQLPREGSSTPALWARLRSAAKRAGVLRYFPDAVGQAFFDDHTPFLRAGIPAIDLIDGTYEHADTTEDTVDKLDKAALDGAGEAVVELLRTLR